MKETYQNGDVIEYSYDNGGNLLSKTVNGVVSNSYAYGDTEWKDLLTGFNGTTITYDEIGNPQNWRDGMSFTWVNGRQLGALQKGDLNVSYSYNSDGLRVSKTVNGVKTEYVWDGTSPVKKNTVFLPKIPLSCVYHTTEGFLNNHFLKPSLRETERLNTRCSLVLSLLSTQK